MLYAINNRLRWELKSMISYSAQQTMCSKLEKMMASSIYEFIFTIITPYANNQHAAVSHAAKIDISDRKKNLLNTQIPSSMQLTSIQGWSSRIAI